MKYRSRGDIIADILVSAQNGNNKTKIMYEAFLSFLQLNEYLDLLQKNGLLVYNEREKVFKTTPKGLEFVKSYSKIGSLVGPERKK